MTDPRLSRLSRIADLVREQETARMAVLRTRVAALRAELAELGPGSDATEPSAFNRAGRAATREAWARNERMRINAELARLRAERAGLADRVARSVARSEVIARLLNPPR